jgi:enoyl-CoA hydratase/carnithine racemase
VSSVSTLVADGVGWVLLDRPDQMNAITVELAEQWEAAIRAHGDDPDVKVIAVRGAGGNFCAGGDFAEVQRLRAEGTEALAYLFSAFRRACGAVEVVPQPVVAVVEGVAMAGGFEFIQASDVVLAHDDARLSDNHVNFGQIPGGGGSQRLPRLVGRQRALGHMLSGERMSGRDAVMWGIAYRSFGDDFESDVQDFLFRMASKEAAALRGIKGLVRAGEELSLDAALDLELEAVVAHIGGDAGGTGEFARRGTAT